MSMESQLQLAIVDGENMLALLSQLSDIARGISGQHRERRPFKVTVSHELHVPGGGRGSNRKRMVSMKAEIGIYVHSIKMNDPLICWIEGRLQRKYGSDEPEWLRRLIDETGSLRTFSGHYNPSNRQGALKLSL